MTYSCFNFFKIQLCIYFFLFLLDFDGFAACKIKNDLVVIILETLSQ